MGSAPGFASSLERTVGISSISPEQNRNFSIPISPDLVQILFGLRDYPPENPKQVLYHALYNPLPLLEIVGSLSTDDKKNKWIRSTERVEVSRVLAKQPYVYRNKLLWYVFHPEEIEKPQLHRLRDVDGKLTDKQVLQLASVYEIDGLLIIGNGNHRLSAAKLLEKETILVRKARPQ